MRANGCETRRERERERGSSRVGLSSGRARRRESDEGAMTVEEGRNTN